MNHRTPAEDFRARLAALSRPQLEEAMRYLRGWNEGIVERALAFANGDVTAPDHRGCGCAEIQGALHSAVAALALPDDTAVLEHAIATGTPVIVEDDEVYLCTYRHTLPGTSTTVYCDQQGPHDVHSAPGIHEGDPDITWTDEPVVYAGDFGKTIAEDGAL